jgi:hypothetical protein
MFKQTNFTWRNANHMSTITLEDVQAVAEGVAGRNPGTSHVVEFGETCKYTYPDGSHCFVGAVSKALGLPLPAQNDPANTKGIETLVNWVQARTDNVFTRDAVKYLARTQAIADEGYYWPDVVAKA